MPPVPINRRRFLGASAAAGWAISHAGVGEANADRPLRLGVIGLGNRGTTLLRTLLEIGGVRVVALADGEGRHRDRAAGIVERATGQRPEGHERIVSVLERPDVDAVVAALPCDLHAATYRDAIRAGKHLYGEKPLAPTLAECDSVIAEADRRPDLAVHVGYQRRSNPRFREAAALVMRGDLGPLIAATAAWNSSNGPIDGHDGWLGSRDRSGDWMVEQAVHVWDVFCWLKGGEPPVSAVGHGRRDLFRVERPGRDVTDDYSVRLEWRDGFRLDFSQTWVAPADDAFTGVVQRVLGKLGGIDFATGTATFRARGQSRVALAPGPQPDTRSALEAFLRSVRAGGSVPPTPPLTLDEARTATAVGLLARRAVDERRVVTWDEVVGSA